MTSVLVILASMVVADCSVPQRSSVRRDVITSRRDVTSGVDRRPRLSRSVRSGRRRHILTPRMRAVLQISVSARRENGTDRRAARLPVSSQA